MGGSASKKTKKEKNPYDVGASKTNWPMGIPLDKHNHFQLKQSSVESIDYRSSLGQFIDFPIEIFVEMLQYLTLKDVTTILRGITIPRNRS